MLTLRPYQNEQVSKLRELFNKGNKRLILCSPTGSGKTIVFTELIRLTLNKSNHSRVLVITDRIELFKQTWKTLVKIGIEPDIYNAKIDPSKLIEGRCVVAMIETLKRRWEKGKELKIGNFDLVIIDEAHKGNFKKVFQIIPNAYYIGATATPLTTTKRDPLKNYYQDILNVIDIPELIKSGDLVNEQVFAMKLVDTSKLVKDSVKGDFTEKSQFDAFNDKKIFDGLIESYKQKAIGKKTIVFCPNIEMTHIVAKQLEVVNPNTYYVTSKSVSHGDRANTLAEYHASSDGIMVNCGILTTGYDHPAIECVILFRATDSIPLYFQMIGRGSRPYPSKTSMTVIDMGENVERIGFWSDSKDWTDIFWNPPKKGNPKPPPMKNCPKCDGMMHVRVMQCNYCGHVFKSKERELYEGVLVEVKSTVNKKLYDLTVQELIKLEEQGVFSSEYVARILRSRHNGYYDLVSYAHMTNKKQGFITLQMKLPKGVRNIEITAEYIQEKIKNVQPKI